MPIYKNNQQINKVYHGTNEVSKVYHNNSLIYEQATPKVDKILIHDFGGKDYFVNGLTHGEWTTRKNTWFSSYYSMVLNPGVVKPFRMPFNATKATLMIEFAMTRMRGVDSYGSAKIQLALTNNPNFDLTNEIKGVEIVSGDANSRFWTNNKNYYTIKELQGTNFVENKEVPTYPAMRYLCRLVTTGAGAGEQNPGYYRYELTDGTQDTYFVAWMYLLTQSSYDKNNEGYVKLGKVYLDLTTDPQFQAYWNS